MLETPLAHELDIPQSSDMNSLQTGYIVLRLGCVSGGVDNFPEELE